MFNGSQPRRRKLFRVVVLEFIKRERAAAGNLNGAAKSGGRYGEQLPHFFRRFEMPRRIGKQQFARRCHGATMLYRRKHVRQRTPARRMEVDAIRCHQWHARLL
jgi:hypothetical protein